MLRSGFSLAHDELSYREDDPQQNVGRYRVLSDYLLLKRPLPLNSSCPYHLPFIREHSRLKGACQTAEPSESLLNVRWDQATANFPSAQGTALVSSSFA